MEKPRGTMLVSTAVILCCASFGLGLAVGGLIPALRGGEGAAPAPEARPAAAVQEKAPDAVAAARNHAAHSPDDPDAWVSLGNACYDARITGEAIKAYERALELRPGVPDVLTDMGSMHRMQGNPAEAVRCYERALAVNPSHANAVYNKGATLLLDMEDAAGALAFWRGVLAKSPDLALSNGSRLADAVPEILADAALLLSGHGHDGAAVKTAELIAGEYPGNARALMAAASVLEKAGRTDEALALRKRAEGASGKAGE